MQKIIPFLWFDGNLENADKFSTSIFKKSTTSNLMPGPGGETDICYLSSNNANE